MCAHAPHTVREWRLWMWCCHVHSITVRPYVETGSSSHVGRRCLGPHGHARSASQGQVNTPGPDCFADPIAGRDARRVREDARVRCHAKSDASHVLRTSLPGSRYASRRRASGDDAWQPGEHPPRSLRCVRGCRTRLIIFRAAGGLSDAVGPHLGHATRGQHHAAPV